MNEYLFYGCLLTIFELIDAHKAVNETKWYLAILCTILLVLLWPLAVVIRIHDIMKRILP